MNKGLYVSVKPKNITLRQYIAYYYFDVSQEEDYVKSFIFYPHIKNALTIYKNASIEFSNGESLVFPDASLSYRMIYTGIKTEAFLAKMKAPYSKIGVAFQPLGISYFVKDAVGTLISKDSDKYNFKGFLSLQSILDEVYSTSNIDKKVELLDAYFIKELKGFKEKRLIEAVNLMLKGDFLVQDISKKIGVNRKTLLRLFKKHLLCSPKDYINIIKFRKALTEYQEAVNKPQLTELAHQHDYYDQSDFIKQFKKITGFNPKKFLGSLTHFGTEDTFWTVTK